MSEKPAIIPSPAIEALSIVREKTMRETELTEMQSEQMTMLAGAVPTLPAAEIRGSTGELLALFGALIVNAKAHENYAAACRQTAANLKRAIEHVLSYEN